MAKVTSKLQVTIPKRIAEQYEIAPGDEIEFEPCGEVIRVIPPRHRPRHELGTEERLRLFDQALARQLEYEQGLEIERQPASGRGWTREQLYKRGTPD